ncbi:MAG: ferridoxin [Deltaproteobacteria bacterium CG_4_8_14_3_um_filter_51_11]|nr:4Fe-4S dicluster domain-containing protein [bacterium]OIP41373.1 MAG: ferridoxin [Desulfobacteraceae bacterium CG2_30_51_40]PIP47332.1 MAG: ferridoxin [Deltaproteobacteria bacterium CG23_combo_of_CG06-09_8_20_14_all_51_20]PIX18210.1 MAG: ferridoxin [Deltaproteobacteria bacterium CG_4_8_14_3_um_filter_51_11]PIY22143.1 MAG: ferridoxin [Deltaproteobacteria bacterium CG_4_10_14_3_um_filter_51_14]PJB35867.1 MAG: ferridoxin [Deltaproteobacteria bacterium CG_4_9_14_3_um_filter_51_14]
MNWMKYLADVVTLQFHKEKCVGCLTCMEVCPQGVFMRDNGRVAVKNRDDCMECGACARNCPAGAITVKAGVGCAAGIINAALGRKGDCCCVVEDGKGASGICC